MVRVLGSKLHVNLIVVFQESCGCWGYIFNQVEVAT